MARLSNFDSYLPYASYLWSANVSHFENNLSTKCATFPGFHDVSLARAAVSYPLAGGWFETAEGFLDAQEKPAKETIQQKPKSALNRKPVAVGAHQPG